ncbi:FkbM family methyltransferase [Brachyspira pilosicoli]|uniref:FkbM family methyltransferase n=1 Tax=Brachyspira pilosicoli TaxID=52584 RepID=UPI003005255A
MDIKTIDKILWWIPFKSLRENLREYMYFQFYIYKYIKNNIVNKDYIRELMFLQHQEIVDKKSVIKFREDIKNDPNFKSRYLKLMKNLDNNSVKILSNILSKICRYNDINDPIYFEYYELEQINKISCKNWKTVMKLDNNHYGYGKYILSTNIFPEDIFYDEYGIGQFQTIDKIRNKNIMDVGGYIGDTAIVLSYHTNKNVYSFEPFIKNYNTMLETIKMNDINNIIPVNISLGDENKKLAVFSDGTINSGNNLYDKKGIAEEIQMMTLDKFVEDNNIEVGLIKVDIEGFEQKFLKGAMRTIIKQKPALLLSIYHNYEDFMEIKNIIEDLNLGYKISIYKLPSPYVLKEVKLIAEII